MPSTFIIFFFVMYGVKNFPGDLNEIQEDNLKMGKCKEA